MLKKIRCECGYTQQKVANFLGIDRSTYSYYESGKINPDIRTILSLSQLFGVNYTEILDADAEFAYNDATRQSTSKLSTVNENDYNKIRENNLIIGFRLLSEDSKEKILRIIVDKIKEEKCCQ